nr:MAG TPA: hypothetical protein [Caudoviricetes sp.]
MRFRVRLRAYPSIMVSVGMVIPPMGPGRVPGLLVLMRASRR